MVDSLQAQGQSVVAAISSGGSVDNREGGGVAALRAELSDLPAAADGVELLNSIEMQIAHLRSEVAQASLH